VEASVALQLSVEGFGEGAVIPARFTCDGENLHPGMKWTGAPADTMSYALIVDDPDSPGGTWTHWLLWDIPVDTRAIAEGKGKAPGTAGMNDFGEVGYGGPCPPKGGGPHRYFFRLFALNAHTLGLTGGARRAALDRALKDHTIGRAVHMGRYERR
jgi:Raf kinase inhibitor-like YbhB/YbcL family protein